MPILAAVMVAALVSMVVSMYGAVKLGAGPDSKWSAVMFGGLVATYVTVGLVVWAIKTQFGQFYPGLAVVPLAMTWAAWRTQKQAQERARS